MRGKYDDNDYNQLNFYEDVHDAKGRFIGNKPNQSFAAQDVYFSPPKSTPEQSTLASKPAPTIAGKASFSNFVVYNPRTPSEVQTFIDYLKRREPAMVKLDKLDQLAAQRALDFISGAIYALGGQIYRMHESLNMFLLMPEGVVISDFIN